MIDPQSNLENTVAALLATQQETTSERIREIIAQFLGLPMFSGITSDQAELGFATK